MKLLGVVEWSDRFATRMLYVRAVLIDPLDTRDHVARPRHAVVVHDVDRDEVGAWSGPGVVGSAARRDACDERAVPAAVTR